MPWNAYKGTNEVKEVKNAEDPVDFDKLEKVNINSLL